MGILNYGQRRPSLKHPEYLDYVRALPCCGCGVHGQQQAHHPIGQRFSQARVSDCLAIPLCDPCHDKLHENWPAWEEKHGSQWMHAADTWEQAVRDGVWNLDKKICGYLSNG
ncbi:hypothetical protein ABIE51_001435 [Lysobacter sp. OAE881]|uniref:DUF968 domain-containing protein n=1 Tax=Lysobacter sp. OAE881 TaxID=2663813 RepID=UPI00178A2552